MEHSGAFISDRSEVLQAFAPPPLPIQAVFPTSRLLSRVPASPDEQFLDS